MCNRNSKKKKKRRWWVEGMIRGCDWVGFFLLAFALTSLVVALPPWLLLFSLVNLFYNKETSTHLLVRACPKPP